MELKLFDSISLSEMGLLRRTCSRTWCSNHGSTRGMIAKASYSSTSNGSYVSKKAINGSMDHQGNVVAENLLHKINGRNGASPSLFPQNLEVLDAFDDEYGGVVVDPHGLPANADVFGRKLHFSVSQWKIKGKKGVWLKLPLERSELVPVAVKEGFHYHHAERGYVMLTYWIPQGPCLLPANASHRVGVGGFVVNGNSEVLVVQEKYCALPYSGPWKIPTGFILESEEIYSGAVREVKEETGIDTEFVEVIAFRHAHNLAFNKSDLFFVCMLRPLSSEIIVDDHEIQAAKWMPLIEFIGQPLIQEDYMFKKIIDICVAWLGKHYCGLSAHNLVSKFDGRLSCLYYNVNHMGNANCSGC